MRVRLSGRPGVLASQETLRLAGEVIPLLENEAAHGELARAWRLIGFAGQKRGPLREGERGRSDKSMKHARLAGDERLIARNAMVLSISSLLGPPPYARRLRSASR